MAGHLINTFLLLGALTLTARWASEKEETGMAERSAVDWTFWLGFIGLILLGVSGAIAALGDTLFGRIARRRLTAGLLANCPFS